MRKKQKATFYCEVLDVIHAAIKGKMNLNNPKWPEDRKVYILFLTK